jgi:hypothetical protein
MLEFYVKLSLRRSVLRERNLEEYRRRRRLRNRLNVHVDRRLKTLKKVYNYPKRVIREPYE